MGPVRKILVGTGLVLGGVQPAMAEYISTDPALYQRGVELYEENCAVCHGENGEGNGPLADQFAPRPRNLTAGVFKLRSTGIGEFPTEADLLETIASGIEGSYGPSMPAFDYLTSDDQLALVEVIRLFAGIDRFGEAIEPGPRPAQTDVARGAELFNEFQCFDCHGTTGNGQGALADQLLDDDGMPIQPANFQTGQFKGGNTPEEIWMRIYTGLDGTPMPSYGRSLTVSDTWSVVDYVLSVSE